MDKLGQRDAILVTLCSLAANAGRAFQMPSLAAPQATVGGMICLNIKCLKYLGAQPYQRYLQLLIIVAITSYVSWCYAKIFKDSVQAPIVSCADVIGI